MPKKELTTLHQVLKDCVIKASIPDESRIGITISDAYFTIFKKRPTKIEIHSYKGIMKVNQYPSEFLPIIKNCINDYFKGRN